MDVDRVERDIHSFRHFVHPSSKVIRIIIISVIRVSAFDFQPIVRFHSELVISSLAWLGINDDKGKEEGGLKHVDCGNKPRMLVKTMTTELKEVGLDVSC